MSEVMREYSNPFDGKLNVDNLPQSMEYLEARQDTVDKIRNDRIASLSERERENFKLVESFVAEMTARGIPYILYTSPENDMKQSTADGKEVVRTLFYRYQNLSNNKDKFSDESITEVSRRLWEAFLAFNQWFTQSNGSGLVVFDPQKTPYAFIDKDGVKFNLQK